MGHPPEQLAAAAADALATATRVPRHEVAIVLGSGWSPAADALGTATAELAVSELPGFAPPSAAGHAGTVRSIDVGGVRVLCFLGRTHLYEGYGVDPVVHSVRVAAAAGCRVAILTNACGALRDGLRVGEPVLISDHLNLTGRSPLTGPRFVDMSDAYDPRLRAQIRELDSSITEGVYAQFAGPQYETPAEVRMARLLGADLVGMSTALETIAARALGCRVLGLSLVTNPAAGLDHAAGPAGGLDHADVLAVGAAAAQRVGSLLASAVPRLWTSTQE